MANRKRVRERKRVGVIERNDREKVNRQTPTEIYKDRQSQTETKTYREMESRRENEKNA